MSGWFSLAWGTPTPSPGWYFAGKSFGWCGLAGVRVAKIVILSELAPKLVYLLGLRVKYASESTLSKSAQLFPWRPSIVEGRVEVTKCPIGRYCQPVR